MHHFGVKVYLTALAMFISSLAARTSRREKGSLKPRA